MPIQHHGPLLLPTERRDERREKTKGGIKPINELNLLTPLETPSHWLSFILWASVFWSLLIQWGQQTEGEELGSLSWFSYGLWLHQLHFYLPRVSILKVVWGFSHVAPYFLFFVKFVIWVSCTLLSSSFNEHQGLSQRLSWCVWELGSWFCWSLQLGYGYLLSRKSSHWAVSPIFI